MAAGAKRDTLGPVFLADNEADIDAICTFAGTVGCEIDIWPLIEGDDDLHCIRLFGTDAEAENARCFIYLGLGLPAHIRPLPW